MKNYATINPCYHCMPLGAIFAAKGFENTISLLHGSQGCATYMRRHLARHFHEPVDVASSSLNEKDAIYGGEENLRKAIRNTYKQYKPQMVVIASTCLSETIGDDINAVIRDIENNSGEMVVSLVSVSTPSYGGSFSRGYWRTIKAALTCLAVRQEKLCSGTEFQNSPSPLPSPQGEEGKKPFINIIPGLVTPRDLRWLHRLGEIWGIDFHIFGDYSDTFDAPWKSSFELIPEGGTPVDYLREAGSALATIEFSTVHPQEDSPALFLQQEFNLSAYRIAYPLGLSAVDKFMEILSAVTAREIPADICADRGRLLDAMADAHKIIFGKRAAIFGESEYVFSAYNALREWGMECPVVVYGESDSSLKDKIAGDEITFMHSIPLAIDNGSMFELKEWLGGNEADLLLGSSVGSSLASEFGLPLLRRGFPVHDRFGAGRVLTIGYEGTLSLLDDTANIFAGQVHSSFRNRLKESYLKA